MSATTVLKKALLLAAGLVVALMAVVVVLVVMRISVDLHFLRGTVAATASTAIGRKVEINGPLTLHFSLAPSLEAADVSVANTPVGKADKLLQAGYVTISLKLPPLLAGGLQLGEIRARDVLLNLESDASGIGNWHLGGQSPPSAANVGDTEIQGAPGNPAGQVRQVELGIPGVDDIALDNLTLNYHDAAIDESLQLYLERVTGSAGVGQAVAVDFDGSVQQKAFSLRLRSDALNRLQQDRSQWGLSIEGQIAGTPLRVAGHGFASSEETGVVLESSHGKVDIGALLAWFGVAEGVEAESKALQVKLRLVGDNLHQLVKQSTIALKLQDGRVVVNDPNTDASFDILALNGDLLMQQANPLTIRLNGDIRGEPLDIQIVGASLAEYVNPAGDLPLTIRLGIAGSQITLTSAVQLPLRDHGLNLKLAFSGSRLDAFNELLQLDLPEVGPLQLEADMTLTKSGYELSKLDVAVGESHLEGSLSLNTTTDKPVVDLALVSPLIQLSDFAPGEQLMGPRVAQTNVKDRPSRVKADSSSSIGPPENTVGLREVLSHEVLNGWDANIRLEAQQVMSGKEQLGSAHMLVTLKDARLAIDPLQVEIPGGGIQSSFSYQARPHDASISFAADIEKLDVGILFRRAKPDTDRGGLITLNTRLGATAPGIDEMMAHASGHLNFRLIPENTSAAISDLWAVNLVSTVLQEVSEESKSQINCVVVRLGMKQGVMREKVIYMDTSRLRVVGQADLDFQQRTLKLLMQPKAKKAELFSLTMPILIQGSFDDFGVRGVALGIVNSAVSFITSPIHVPLRRVFSEKVPPDGQQACEEAWARTSAETWQPRGNVPSGTESANP